MNYHVKTEKFTGPLELLLDLIEKRKLFVNDISLGKVADDFIEYVKTKENLPIGETAHFILVASTLLLIKSKSLLPNLTLSIEEENDIKDLENRLKIYQKIKEVSLELNKIYNKNKLREPVRERSREIVFSPSKNITIENIATLIKKMIDAFPVKNILPNVVIKKVISLEEMISRLTDKINRSLKTSFKEFSGGEKGEKINIIVSFLAMLELVKNGVIKVNQNKDFDDIHIETNEIGIPRYN